MDKSITEVKAAEILDAKPKKPKGRPPGVKNKQVRKDKGTLRGAHKPKRILPIETTPTQDITYFEGSEHAESKSIDKQA